MVNNKIDTIEIKRKNEIVDNAISVLKKEFVGIDKQIEEVMDNVRTWYIYPQLQIRPLVINLFGMSGIGKTSLVKRISQLLDIEKDYVYFNFASISEQSSYEIESQIEEELANEQSNRMFVYDEFQYAATINPQSGEEKDNKTGLKPFWELLDSGLIHKRSNYWNIRMPLKVLEYMFKINTKVKMVIENGVWVNSKECLEHFKPYDIMKFSEVFEFEITDGSVPRITPCHTDDYCYETIEESQYKSHENNTSMPFFIKEYYLNKIIELNDTSNGSYSDKIDTFHSLERMDCDQVIDFITKVFENARKGYDLKFNDSIIFVIGNLDEAYEMSFNVNPDMSPDQFRKITEKISVVDIKDALKKRFRNEQIARLGNIHVIYPSFSSQNFKDIIQMSLDNYSKEAYELSGFKLEFDDTVKDIIYEEGVYPTHGTRPIFSTVHEIVKSRFPIIIRHICENNVVNEVNVIKYTFDNDTDELVIHCYDKDNTLILSKSFDIKLRLKKLRKSDNNDDEQALCALHESGHFVMYARLLGKMPEKLVSRTTDANTGGFLMEDYEEIKKKVSKTDMLNEIKVLLGGYVAEKMVFGDEMSIGAQNDLERATKIASQMVRRYGFGKNTYVSTASAPPDDSYGFFVWEDNKNLKDTNDFIKQIIEECEKYVSDTFRIFDWSKMLKESALYLCDNSAMPKEKMQEIYDKVPARIKRIPRDNDFYREKIKNM